MMKRLLCAALALVLIIGLVPLRASAVDLMCASEECVEFIKNIEGFHAIPYWDYSQWTVGFGNMCPDQDLQRYMEEGIPVEEAEALLRKNMIYFNRELNKFMTRNKLQLTQQQYDALFSLTFNIGTTWLYKADHSVVQAVVKGLEGNEFIYQMGLRSNAGGQFLEGLLKRRLMEADLYLNGRYNTTLPDDYGIVYYDSGEGTCEAAAQGYDMHLPARPLAVPTYEGYTFKGWYTAPDGGVPVTALDKYTDGMTLYALWEKVGVAHNLPGNPIKDTPVKVTSYMLNIRTGPGTSYSVATSVPQGTELTITAIALRGGVTWGKCRQGWLSLHHTDYPLETNDREENGDETGAVKLPTDATVLNEIKVYNGPHDSYPQTGKLAQGRQIRVVQLQQFMGKLWAKCEAGWVKVDRNLMFHDENRLTHSFVATVTNSYLNVRNGPGTQFTLAGTLNQGQQVEILAVEQVNGTAWGLCSQGWISLRYTDFDETMLPRYRSHTFDDWYDMTASSCTQQGQQRRDCLDCDHYETQIGELKQHNFGDWYEFIAPTYDEPGQKWHDCVDCGYREIQDIPCLQQPNILIYGTVTGCDVLNVRAAAGAGNAWVGTLSRGQRVQVLEQVMVDGKVWGRCDKGWFCITGYVTLETIQEEAEPTRIMTVTAYRLNVRAGAGFGYQVVAILSQGQQVEVLEIQTVNGKEWARIAEGWVGTTYLQ